ncbi:MAG: metalloregulator ArsR/SmtB family transcription factor [Candidatus Hydrogenedentota bacterium]
MTEESEPTEQWRESAELLRLLGHPLRLALLADLLEGPRCVTDLQQLLNARQANISQHLAVLRHARLVGFHEEANTRCYYLRRPGLVRALLTLLRDDYPAVSLSKQEIKRRAAHREE